MMRLLDKAQMITTLKCGCSNKEFRNFYLSKEAAHWAASLLKYVTTDKRFASINNIFPKD